FFQAEDGIRDFHVTGVQTCALPIYQAVVGHENLVVVRAEMFRDQVRINELVALLAVRLLEADGKGHQVLLAHLRQQADNDAGIRSEERRVGKGGRYRWPAGMSKEKR